MCGCPCICECVPLFFTPQPLYSHKLKCVWRVFEIPSVCVFPPLFVLASSCNQEHFCIPKMGFGVEGTFQTFFMTLTPMFSLHIKLLGGPQNCFFLTTLRKNVVLGDYHTKMFSSLHSLQPHINSLRLFVVLQHLAPQQLRWCCLISSLKTLWLHAAMVKSEIRCHHSSNHNTSCKTRLRICVSENTVVLPLLLLLTAACFIYLALM